MEAKRASRGEAAGVKIFDMVKQQIIHDLEKMEPHTRLPGRQALCEQYFVSRDTIDRVIASLKSENYLYTIRNSGTFVSDPSISLNISTKLPPKTIGVLMPTSGINSSVDVAKGIDDYAGRHGLRVVHCITDHNPQKMESYIRRLILSGVAGLLIQPPSIVRSYSEASALIQTAGIPVVFMFEAFPNMTDYPLVTVNTLRPENIEFAFERGYRHMAYVSNHGNFSRDSNLRIYLSVLAHRGIEDCYHHVLVENNLPREAFVRKVQQLLAKPEPPDVVYCFNDTEAGMVYDAIRRSGLRISEDVGVIGSDDSPIAARMDPPLTSVHISAYDIGYVGCGWIAQFVQSGKMPYQRLKLFQPRLVDRASCRGKGASSSGFQNEN